MESQVILTNADGDEMLVFIPSEDAVLGATIRDWTVTAILITEAQ